MRRRPRELLEREHCGAFSSSTYAHDRAQMLACIGRVRGNCPSAVMAVNYDSSRSDASSIAAIEHEADDCGQRLPTCLRQACLTTSARGKGDRAEPWSARTDRSIATDEWQDVSPECVSRSRKREERLQVLACRTTSLDPPVLEIAIVAARLRQHRTQRSNSMRQFEELGIFRPASSTISQVCSRQRYRTRSAAYRRDPDRSAAERVDDVAPERRRSQDYGSTGAPLDRGELDGRVS